MTIDQKARGEVRQALIKYMAGDIKSFEFDEDVSRFHWTKATNDNSVRLISRELWRTYDAVVDHPISVTQEGWLALRRIVAFLDTDMDVEKTADYDAWPFRDQEEWLRHEYLLNETNLPHFDPTIHSLHVNPWWNRIPTTVGFLIIFGTYAIIFFIGAVISRL